MMKRPPRRRRQLIKNQECRENRGEVATENPDVEETDMQIMCNVQKDSSK